MYFLPTLRIAPSKPVQKPKPLRNKENVKPKKKIPPSKAPSKSMYDQSPEDSFNISIQNEKAMNKQLNQLQNMNVKLVFIVTIIILLFLQSQCV